MMVIIFFSVDGLALSDFRHPSLLLLVSYVEELVFNDGGYLYQFGRVFSAMVVLFYLFCVDVWNSVVEGQILFSVKGWPLVVTRDQFLFLCKAGF